MALTRNELGKMGCGTPGCDHDHSVVYLNQRCHPSAATWASYNKRTGNLTIACAECEKPIAEIAVAMGQRHGFGRRPH